MGTIVSLDTLMRRVEAFEVRRFAEKVMKRRQAVFDKLARM